MTQPDFIQIPTQLLNDPALQPLDRIVYGYVYWMHKLKDGTCTASNETLADLCGAATGAISRSLGRLETGGYVQRIYEDEVSRHRERIDCLVTYVKTLHQTVKAPTPNGVGPLAPNGEHSNSINKKSSEGEIVLSEQSAKPGKVDKRDPEVTEMIQYFETAMALKMPRPQYQRRAAKSLILRWGLPTALRAVDAVVASRDQKFAPRILSLEDLRDKWNKLTDFYRRTGSDLKKRQAASDEIKKVTGVE